MLGPRCSFIVKVVPGYMPTNVHSQVITCHIENKKVQVRTCRTLYMYIKSTKDAAPPLATSTLKKAASVSEIFVISVTLIRCDTNRTSQ
jgi:hypothetical protein